MKKIISALIVITMLCMALVAAVPAFAAEETVDYSKLESLIKEFDSYYADDYTAETWAVLQEKLAAAKEALKATTQAEVNAAFDALDAAKKGLKGPDVTREMLKEQIDRATALVEAEYTKATWDALKLALDAAEEIYGKQIAVSTLLEPKYTALKKALREMKYETAALQAVINKANAINEASIFAEKLNFGADYTEATLTPFRTALNTAKTNVKSNDLTKINASITELEAAMAALVTNPAPQSMKDKCAELLELADLLIPADWPDAAWGMVEKKVKQAQDAPNDPKVSTYVKAATELETALKNLTNDKKTSKEVLPDPPVVDTAYLQDLIKWCDDNLVETAYTADSWKLLKQNYERAKGVVENPKKAEYVKSAWAALKDAKDKLVPVDPSVAATGDAATATPSGSEDIVEVGCGGVVGTTAVVLTAVLGLGAAVVAKKRED